MNNEHYTQLINYISEHLRQGFSEAIIRQTLHQHGWDAAIVDSAFTTLHAPAPVIPEAPRAPAGPVAQNVQHYTQLPSQPTESAPAMDFSASATQAQDAAPSAKYKLFHSIAETYRAIRYNLSAVFLGILVSYVLGTATVALILFVMTLAIRGTNWPNYSTNSFIATAVESIVFLIAYVLMQSLFLVLPALAVFDGAEGRKTRFGALFKSGIKKIWHVAVASSLLWIVVVAPILVTSAVTFGFLLGVRTSGSTIFVILTPLLLLVAVVISLILLLRYSLAPYVAIFEPAVPVTKTLRRSKQLLMSGGQWFLLKGALLIILVIIVLSLVSGADVQELKNTDSLLVNIGAFIISMFANGVVVLLYRNRRTLKG